MLSEPTTARPGSPEKVRILEMRAAHGLDLWHPLDPTDFDKRRAVPWEVPVVEVDKFPLLTRP